MSYVAMEQNVCPVCGKKHEVGILLHKGLEDIEDQTTGYSLCDHHQAKFEDGYIALIEVEGEQPVNVFRSSMNDVVRTGRVMYADKRLFDVEDTPMAFVTTKTYEHVEKMHSDLSDSLH